MGTAVNSRWLHPSAHADNVLFAYSAGLVVLGEKVVGLPLYLPGGRGFLAKAALQAHVGMQLHRVENTKAGERVRVKALSEASRDVVVADT